MNDGARKTTTETIRTDAAPAAIGAYSQGIAAAGFIFFSGQIAIDPATQTFTEGDAAAQARIVMRNIGALLAAAGVGFADVIKTTIFLANMDDFAAVNAVYAESFDGPSPPARSTVAVAGLPRGAKVEIETIALRP